MSVKLGEMLINAGVVTSEDLDECLKSQVIFGGRLGTNLIEMGLVEEKQLGKILSQKYSVRYIAGDTLMQVPEKTLQLIPVELIRKYKVIPLSLDKRRLTLAMLDPGDLTAIDEISFVTGFIIDPVVCPEIRLFLALEKYFDIPREKRYFSMKGASRASRIARDAQHSQETAGPAEINPFEEIMKDGSLSLPIEGNLTIEERNDYQLGGTPAGFQPPPVEAQQEPVPSQQEECEPADSIDYLSIRLAETVDRDDVVEGIIKYTGRSFRTSAFFMIRGNIAKGWIAKGEGGIIDSFPDLSIPLDSPSILKDVVESKNLYLGPITDTPSNEIMIKALKSGKPESCLLIPLLMSGRVVTIFYVEGSVEKLSQSLAELTKLMAKGVLAFEILVLKNKLLSL